MPVTTAGREPQESDSGSDDDLTVPLRSGDPADDWFLELALQARHTSDAALHLLLNDPGSRQPSSDTDRLAPRPLKEPQ